MLAENMKVTSEAVLASRQARRIVLRDIAVNMINMLRQWNKIRDDETSRREDDMKELRATLATGRTALRGEVGSLRQEAISALEEMGKARLEQATTLLSELHMNRERDRRRSKQFLRNTGNTRELKSKELKRSLNSSLEGMRRAVGQTRLMIKADMDQARDEWRKCASGGLTGPIMATDMPINANITAKKPAVKKPVPQAMEKADGHGFFAERKKEITPVKMKNKKRRA